MEVTDEKLIAYLDGELPDEEKLQLDLLLSEDSSLKQRLETFQELDNKLTKAYESIEDRPYSTEIQQMLSSTNVAEPAGNEKMDESAIDLHSRVLAIISQMFSKPAWPSVITATFALSLGILLGNQFGTTSGPATELTMELVGVIHPESQLHSVLESNLANETSQISVGQIATVMPVLTFRAVDARYCREFTIIAEQQGSRGIACREGGNWHLEMLTRDDSVETVSGQFTTASDLTAVALDNLFNSLAADAPMDANSESSLIERGWAD